MFHSMKEFLATLEGVRKRTLNYALNLPDDRADWTPVEGKFTAGDLIRHLGSAEAMFSRVVAGGAWCYDGHGQEKGASIKEALDFLEGQHQAAIYHRGQLATYLQMVGRQPPQIYGLKIEEVPRATGDG